MCVCVCVCVCVRLCVSGCKSSSTGLVCWLFNEICSSKEKAGVIIFNSCKAEQKWVEWPCL